MISVDLKTHSAKNGKTIIIKNGKPCNGFKINQEPVSISDIESLYQIYKYSVPDGIKYKTSYFKALTEEQMNTQDLILGANRKEAKQNLEMTLLTGILNGSLTWPDERKWFWQSETDKDLVLLREWF